VQFHPYFDQAERWPVERATALVALLIAFAAIALVVGTAIPATTWCPSSHGAR
jgi:hypothetical protein